MMRCPITYAPLSSSSQRYQQKGLHLLSKNLKSLNDFPIKNKVISPHEKLILPDTCHPLNVSLNVNKACFEESNTASTFHLKLPHPEWPHLPENEDITMRLAFVAGLETPLHGLVYNTDGSFSFWRRRIDRPSLKSPTRLKLAMENFIQLRGENSQKQPESLEQAAVLLETYATFPMVEKEKLLRWVIFNFLVGNTQATFKDLALITDKDIVLLSPAFNLISTTLLEREMSDNYLFLHNKQKHFKGDDFIQYFALECLKITPIRIKLILKQLIVAAKKWPSIIQISFLPDAVKKDYIALINQQLRSLLGQ